MRAMGHGEPPHDVEQQIAGAREAQQESARLRTRLATSETHLQECVAATAEAQSALSAEGHDVARLEATVSWSRVLSTLKGSHATDLERERAEQQAAAYRAQATATREQAARQDVASYQSQLAALGDTAARYQDALTAKEAWLDGAGESGRRLAEIAERRGAIAAETTEVAEAQAAGAQALELLRQAATLLGKARDWAGWDTFGGGGLFTDMMKYDRLDQAGTALRNADIALAAFTRELSDVHLAGVEQVAPDAMTRAFDVWFDNIFTDLRVRRRIIDAHERVGEALARVVDTLAELQRRASALGAEGTALTTERERILAG
jgi:hypothetical protein